MKSNIFIPKKCKVGFNERGDTYTGLLGYIIQFDGKKWRKENSWESWRQKYISKEEAERKKMESYNSQVSGLFGRAKDNGGVLEKQWINGKYFTLDNIKTEEDIIKVYPYEDFNYHMGNVSSNPKIKPLEFENEAIEGFVLNKKAGGGNYGWNPRQTYCRVYDPRGFEFEITIPNLLYILENTNSIKGKGLEGKFIYGWAGKDLVLVPENAPEFEQMVQFTELQDGKVYKKDLVVGRIYINSQGEKLTYLDEAYELDYSGYLSSEKKRLWFDCNGGKYFQTYSSVQPLKAYTGEDAHNLPELMNRLAKDDKYYPGDIEYEKIEDPLGYLEEKLKKDEDYYSRTTKGLFIKSTSGKFLNFSVSRSKEYSSSFLRASYNREEKTVYRINSSFRNGETYNEIKHIIYKYPEIWQLKMTK